VWVDRLRLSSAFTLAAWIVHLLASLWLPGQILLTDSIAQWLMARTPNRLALAILDVFGAWAKPAAATGGLALLGFTILLAVRFGWWIAPAAGGLYWYVFDNPGWTFWLPSLTILLWRAVTTRENIRKADGKGTGRRAALKQLASPIVMTAGTAIVAVESRWREDRLERNSVTPSAMLPAPPDLSSRESFAPGLVRTAITPTAEFYGMSKNTVDPAIDPRAWRLRITLDGKPLREWSYSELLALPRTERYVSLRCISNTLKSNLMGCAHWSGVSLQSLVDTGRLPSNIRELAIIGVDGHDDSLSIDYALSDGPFFALGMNGMSLNRTHGFPIRLLAPRYYGLKSVKWISELRFVTEPYHGTWPKLGYTKEPLVHTCCYIDKVRKVSGTVEAGGIAMAGDRGVKQVQVRIDDREWVNAHLEQPLSAQTWVRWRARVALPASWNSDSQIEARAQDGQGRWQPTNETPLFPNGVQGPTIRRLAL